MGGKNKKRIVLILRWTVIIATSYLILFGKEGIPDFEVGNGFILFYILSNIILIFFPHAWFSNPRLFYGLVIFDTGIVSLGMYLSETVTADFYLIFFLIIIFASMSRNYKLLMTISAITAALYGVRLYTLGLLSSLNATSYALRMPFIFIMAAFYGYLVETFTKEKQEELAISEDKYRGLFQNANDGIIILRNPEFLIADINREGERLTGYKKGELLYRGFIELCRSIEEGNPLDFIKEVLRKGEARTDSLSLLRKDGTQLEADLSAKRIDLGEESFYQVIFRDLTEQRKLEKKIREAKMNLEAIFDGIRDRLSLQDTNYRVLRVNRSVIEHCHTSYQDLIGRKCHEAYYQKTSPCERCPVAVTIETQKPASSILKISKTDTTLQVFSYPILDEQGKLISIIEYVRDITEEQKLQEQLIQSEKLAGIGTLASGVAHEINNPLTVIIGMAEVAIEEENPTEIKTYLKDIFRCSQRIKDIVKGLSSYARIARQDEQGLVSINEVLEESLKMVGLAMKAHEVQVIKKFRSTDKMEANIGEIQQVFTNLITNAFQAMDGRGGKLTLDTRSLKDSIEVKVSDTGTGIPQKYLNKIFDPFFTTKELGKGTGLGLNIVHRIVQKYEGTINVWSKEGKGTTFTITFPVNKDE
jgi:two-component system cell cycle sensor histidine kinase/response regulator CckA